MTETSTQLTVIVNEPVTGNEQKTFYGSSILIKNAGDDDVIINRGFTLLEGDSLTLKTGNDNNIIVWNMNFIWLNRGVAPKLEILTLLPEGAEFYNYNPR